MWSDWMSISPALKPLGTSRNVAAIAATTNSIYSMSTTKVSTNGQDLLLLFSFLRVCAS